MRKVKVGVIGCGNISGIYFQAGQTFEILDIVACADLIPERAQAAAEKYGIPKACTTEELLADPEIEIVVNLTIPQAHAEVSLAAIEAGKHVYVEKPLAVTREDGLKVLEAAKAKGLRVGGAPDTFLGGGLQTCRSSSTTVGSASLLGPRPLCFAMVMKAGIPIQSSTTRLAVAQCLIWGPTT